MPRKKRTKSRSSYGGGRTARQTVRSSEWEKQINRELFKDDDMLPLTRRMLRRQTGFKFRLSAEDYATARSILGSRRKKLSPSKYAGAMAMKGGPRQYRTAAGRFTPAHPGYREFGMVEKNPCERRKERRQVLLAKGKVNRPGGAPGPYKKRSKIQWDC